MPPALERVLSITVAVCAVVVAGTVVHQHFIAPKASPARRPTYVAGWEELRQRGLRIGTLDARVQIVEFGDFQCPFCREFHLGVEQLIAEFPGEVALVYYHFPLPNHAQAERAARAATCGADQGRFGQIAREMFSGQSALGTRSWASYAHGAGIVDTVGFVRCMESESTLTRIRADMVLASRLSVTATPTVIVNGWRFPSPPSADSLRSIARSFRAGRSPFSRR